ncbi:hypothetical protein ACFLT2_05610 [Acidobacteriota bacterium]
MYDKLEKYLEEIDHLLVVSEGRQEILEEIRSHILERAEDESGQVTDESLAMAISRYGSSQQVASKYVGDYQIISPTFKKYLFRYTGILFVVHMLLIFFASLFNTNVYLFPFFFIPRLDLIHVLNFIPMALLYDLGLVGVVLYFITQKNKEIRLPWLKLKLPGPDGQAPGLPKPKPLVLLFMSVGFVLVLAVFIHFQTLFFYSLNFNEPKSLFGSTASLWYSLALLFVFGVAVLSYALRFICNSRWIELAKYGIFLSVFFLVINVPIADAHFFMDYPELKMMALVIISVIAVLYAYEFLKALIFIVRDSLQSKPTGSF